MLGGLHQQAFMPQQRGVPVTATPHSPVMVGRPHRQVSMPRQRGGVWCQLPPHVPCGAMLRLAREGERRALAGWHPFPDRQWCLAMDSSTSRLGRSSVTTACWHTLSTQPWQWLAGPGMDSHKIWRAAAAGSGHGASSHRMASRQLLACAGWSMAQPCQRRPEPCGALHWREERRSRILSGGSGDHVRWPRRCWIHGGGHWMRTHRAWICCFIGLQAHAVGHPRRRRTELGKGTAGHGI